MNLKEQVQKYLEDVPPARERVNKNKALVNLLIRQNPLFQKCIEKDFITKEMLITFLENGLSMDRSWRQILRDTPALRGSDYWQKDELEIQKLEELNYGQTP